MKINVQDVPLSGNLLYKYLLDTALFPIGFAASPEQYLETIEREHKRNGGSISRAKDPLQEMTSCLKQLEKRGYFSLPFRYSWERIELNVNELKEEQEDVAAIIAAATMLNLVS